MFGESFTGLLRLLLDTRETRVRVVRWRFRSLWRGVSDCARGGVADRNVAGLDHLRRSCLRGLLEALAKSINDLRLLVDDGAHPLDLFLLLAQLAAHLFDVRIAGSCLVARRSRSVGCHRACG